MKSTGRDRPVGGGADIQVYFGRSHPDYPHIEAMMAHVSQDGQNLTVVVMHDAVSMLIARPDELYNTDLRQEFIKGTSTQTISHSSTVIVYSRAQAIADGVLIDVTEVARQAGFKSPVAVTEAVWNSYVDGGDILSDTNIDSEEADRLWYLLKLIHGVIEKHKKVGEKSDHLFTSINNLRTKEWIDFKIVCGPGDNAEPVITIMFADEN